MFGRYGNLPYVHSLNVEQELCLPFCGGSIHALLHYARCDYKSGGDKFTRRYYDVAFETTIFDAHTGSRLGAHTIEMESEHEGSTFLKTYGIRDSEWYNQPDEYEYSDVLRLYIKP